MTSSSGVMAPPMERPSVPGSSGRLRKKSRWNGMATSSKAQTFLRWITMLKMASINPTANRKVPNTRTCGGIAIRVAP